MVILRTLLLAFGVGWIGLAGTSASPFAAPLQARSAALPPIDYRGGEIFVPETVHYQRYYHRHYPRHYYGRPYYNRPYRYNRPHGYYRPYRYHAPYRHYAPRYYR